MARVETLSGNWDICPMKWLFWIFRNIYEKSSKYLPMENAFFFKSFIARDFCISYYTLYIFVLFFNVWGRGKVGEMGLRRFVCLGIVLVCWCRGFVRFSFVCVHFCLLVCCAVPRWGHVENCLDCFAAAHRLICWYFVDEIDFTEYCHRFVFLP